MTKQIFFILILIDLLLYYLYYLLKFLSRKKNVILFDLYFFHKINIFSYIFFSINYIDATIQLNHIFINRLQLNEVIDMCDVTITILSQTSYLSLIREKPVVMLGYTQLKGKGCTYEAFDRDHLERSIEEALQMGYTQEQKDNFYLHVAQMNKYYVYDDLNERELRYGQSVQQFVDYLLTNV